MSTRERPAMTLVGTLPPTKGISDTCLEQLRHIGPRLPVRFLGFAQLYPERLYPGGTRDGNQTPELPGVEILRPMRWYDPTSWVRAGFLVTGDICHIHWWTWYLFGPLFTVLLIARLRGKRIVLNVHNVVGHESHLLDRVLSRVFVRAAHRAIVHSGVNARQLTETHGVPPRRVRMIPLGTPDFLVADVARDDARAALGLPADRVILLGFGNIRRYKGTDALLTAYAALRRRLDPGRLWLVIAGKPWIDWQPLQAQIDRDGLDDALTLYLDFVPAADVPRYFAAADLLVLPYTHFDAQSGPGRIALGYGLPTVVTRTGGLPDLVGDDPRCVAPAGDVGALVDRLAALIDDPDARRELSAAALARRGAFSWPSVADRTLALYDELRASAR